MDAAKSFTSPNNLSGIGKLEEQDVPKSEDGQLITRYLLRCPIGCKVCSANIYVVIKDVPPKKLAKDIIGSLPQILIMVRI